ncbi:hypothetical protein Raf01_40570 [Rugosimonospora africana]|uniref:Uncharacterized protein n=1 Tax=Rugosimonospora africana TaxID=556532 RepID=A0A8J3QR29_9ACTN|nr:hypothetical protein Raf01_40570 [Rugosimonospora africana]
MSLVSAVSLAVPFLPAVSVSLAVSVLPAVSLTPRVSVTLAASLVSGSRAAPADASRCVGMTETLRVKGDGWRRVRPPDQGAKSVRS